MSKRKVKEIEEMPAHIAMLHVDDYTKDDLWEMWKEEQESNRLHKHFKNITEEIENE